MSSFYNQYTDNYKQKVFMNNGNIIRPLQRPPCPIMPNFNPQMYPYPPVPPPFMPFIYKRKRQLKLPQPYAPLMNYYPQRFKYDEETCQASQDTHLNVIEENDNNDNSQNDNSGHMNDTTEMKNELFDDPLEFYLSLPKRLFPIARTMFADPNPIIDEFCKIPNIQNHALWILDLEFGLPLTLTTRSVASYNVKNNNISCKNALDAIHPGFENCPRDFKRAMAFYYDCIFSSWYKGYVSLNSDNSVENYQQWILKPVHILGMSWS